MMSSSKAKMLMFCAVMVLLAASTSAAAASRVLLQQSKLEQCRAGFAGLTDVNAVRPKVPSCTAEQIDLQKCCDEVKGILSTGSGPSDCLCDPEVWNQVQGQVLSAGIPNLTAETFVAFTEMCGIPNAGAKTC